MKIILTVGITSYNRIDELKRCLESIETKEPRQIEVLVSEDKSPMRNEIRTMVEDFASKSPFSVRFHSNKENLGYDRNLKNIINMARGEYVYFMSDDDVLYPETIDKTLDVIKKYSPAVHYGSCYVEEMQGKRRNYHKSSLIEKGVKQAAYYIYDAILFSGLVFKRDVVTGLDAEPFLNKNYFQIYMFLYCIVFYGGFYLKHLSVHAMSDGENAYGKSESSDHNPLLADRKSYLSNLEFHKGLIYVIKKFDEDYGTEIFNGFECQYNLHSYTGLAFAETLGKEELKEYWKKMNSLDITINVIPRIYYILLFLLGNKVSSKILDIPKRMFLSSRNESY